eukprot:13376056-Alexandrium_andersonii.AAC.1
MALVHPASPLPSTTRVRMPGTQLAGFDHGDASRNKAQSVRLLDLRTGTVHAHNKLLIHHHLRLAPRLGSGFFSNMHLA